MELSPERLEAREHYRAIIMGYIACQPLENTTESSDER